MQVNNKKMHSHASQHFLKTTSTDTSDIRFNKKITEDADEEKETIAELNERMNTLRIAWVNPKKLILRVCKS